MEVQLSKSEQKLYDLIPSRRNRQGVSRKITTEELAAAFYDGELPYNGRVRIASLVRSLKYKTPRIEGLRKVKSTEGSGRKSIEVWLEA